MKKKFEISFDTFIGILSSAYTYYKTQEDLGRLDYNEHWESIVRDKLEEFLSTSPSNEFKIVEK